MVKYNDLYDVIHNNAEFTSDHKFVAIVPVLRIYNADNEIIDYIIYDQFTTVLQVEKSEFDPNDVSMFADIFKYTVHDSGVSFNFDVESSFDSFLEYRIMNHNGEICYSDNYGDEDGWIQLEDFNFGGQNIFNVYFNGDDGNDRGFVKEDLYLFSFRVLPKNLSGSTEEARNKFIELYPSLQKDVKIFASEVINKYERLYDNYLSSEFTLDEKSFAEAAVDWFKVKANFKNRTTKDNTWTYKVIDEEGIHNGTLENGLDTTIVDLDDYNGFFKPQFSLNRSDFNKTITFTSGSKHT